MNDRTTGRRRLVITGPELKVGAGISRHVENLQEVFSNDQDFLFVPFAVTSVAYVEPWLLKVVRLCGKYAAFVPAVVPANLVHINSTLDRRSVLRDAGLVLLSKVMGKGVVLQFHGGSFARLGGLAQGLPARILGSVLAMADAVLFFSQDQAVPTSRAFGLHGVRCVANFIDEGSVDCRTSVDKTLHVLFLSRLDSEKGVLEAVRGFVEASLPSARMTVAGAGDAEEAARRAAEGEADIHFAGIVAGETKRSLLAEADVLVLPSRHDEGMPYSLLEAAASGTALLATDRGATSQIVRHGENGYVLKCGDASEIAERLRQLASDPTLLQRMKCASRSIFEAGFSVVPMRATFREIYEGVVR